MRNESLEKIRLALLELVGTLNSNTPTQVDTAAFCKQYKVPAEFFDALRKRGCLIQDHTKPAGQQWYVLAKHLYSIEPVEVEKAIRQQQRRPDAAVQPPIEWQDPQEENAAPTTAPVPTERVKRPRPPKSETPMLDKALDQVQALPNALKGELPVIKKTLNAMAKACIQLPGAVESKQTVPTLIDEGPLTKAPEPVTQTQVMIDTTFERLLLFSAIEQETADDIIRQAVKRVTYHSDSPQKQVILYGMIGEELRKHQQAEAIRLEEQSVDLQRQLSDSQQKATAFRNALNLSGHA